jgi:vacuolar-type H+-ATPase subunit E/Vma4
MQESLEESLNRIRQDTDQKLNLFRTEIRQEFGSIEDKIVAAVVKAVTPAQENDTNDSTMTDANSIMTTTQDSQTVSTLTEKVDNCSCLMGPGGHHNVPSTISTTCRRNQQKLSSKIQ